jgi:hypothetical protein
MADISDNGGFNLGLANIASQNYGPTATAGQANTNASTDNTRASTALTQQQTAAASMQNKIMAARMPLVLSQLNDYVHPTNVNKSGLTPGGGDEEGSDDSDEHNSDESGVAGASGTPKIASNDKSAVPADQNFYQPHLIDSKLREKYFVPAYTPQEMSALQRSYIIDPKDENGMGPKRIMSLHDMRVAQQTQNNQLEANDDFDKLHAVVDAPEGSAMDVLEASHPETVAAIRRQFKKEPDSQAAQDEDSSARLFASHTAGAVHQYTGREAVKGDDGVYRDEVTGVAIPGVEKVGLSTEQYIKLAHEAITPSVEMDDGNGGKIKVAPWKAAQMGGAKNINGPGDWMMVRASQSGLPGAAATLSPNSAQKQEARATAQAALEKVQKMHEDAPATNPDGTPKSSNGVSAARNAQGNIDPQLTTALHDKDYDYKPTNNGEEYKPQIGHTPPQAVLDDMKKQTDARNDLAKTSSQGVGAAAAALTMYKAAQDVLDKGNYNGGAWNQELAKYSKWLPAGWQTHMTGDYQEVAKYLGNAALQSGKGIFAKMTEKESDAVMHDLNPSPGMDANALRDMIGRGAKTAQYALDSAKRVPAYLHASKDANQFGTWNQTHFPMEEATKPNPAAPTGKAPKYNDAQVRAYMQKHGLKDEMATRKALGL